MPGEPRYSSSVNEQDELKVTIWLYFSTFFERTSLCRSNSTVHNSDFSILMLITSKLLIRPMMLQSYRTKNNLIRKQVFWLISDSTLTKLTRAASLWVQLFSERP